MIRHQPELVNEARKLRLQKLSFQEIGRRLNIPGNTIRHWCYDLEIDRHESLRINNHLRRELVKQLDIDLVPQLSDLSTEQARIFTALLYGCEGCKYPSYNIVSFVNSDPSLIKTFVFLLRKSFTLEESKFRVHLQIHDTHRPDSIKKFWSDLLEIPEGQFLKFTITSPRGKMRRQNYLGTCTVRYLDNKIQLRLLGIYEKFCSPGEVS